MPLAEFKESLRVDVPLAPMTTLGIGGPARYFAKVATTEALIAGVEWARANSLPLFVLGGGSNILVADDGFRGLVLRVSILGIETRIANNDVVVTSGAGEDWDSLVARCVNNDWAGFECLSGIPGRVGATPIQNVGAYGQETSETLVSLQALDLTTATVVELSATECDFGYRTSRFKTRDRDRFIITRVTYLLGQKRTTVVRYAELEKYLTEQGTKQPSVAEVREAVVTIRRRKAMVIDPNDADSHSAGSFFVNPTVTLEDSEQITHRADKFSRAGNPMPTFQAADNKVKLSAAWLIERSGIERGFVHGNVGTSSKHALAIINRGGGTAREVVELKDLIQERVLDRFGVALTPEPIFVGFQS